MFPERTGPESRQLAGAQLGGRGFLQLAIRTKDNTQGAQEEAAKYRQAPLQRKDNN